MKFIKQIIAVCGISLLTACATAPSAQSITIKKTPPALLEECRIPKPPEEPDYKAGGDRGKIIVLYNLAIELYGALAECNGQLKNIKKRENALASSVGG